jgi:hypothetical protein
VKISLRNKNKLGNMCVEAAVGYAATKKQKVAKKPILIEMKEPHLHYVRSESRKKAYTD